MAHRLVAIDPLALLLSPSVYIRLTLPDPPPPDVLAPEIRALVRDMDAGERKAALARAKSLGAFAKALEKELGAASKG
ncbi:MAG TPA: hypothetical protein DD490_27480 [Acidobacteria bacterium]|nr:hypothetical protein [Acidobacteriota bacterium]